MYRELKIVALIVLVYFIYGLSSFFSLGAFVTPFFFGKIILTIVSFTFFLRYIKIEKSYYLFFSFLAMLSLALADGFTIRLFSERFGFKSFLDFCDSPIVIYSTFFIFTAFLFTSIFILHKELKKYWITILLIIVLLSTYLLLYLKLYTAHQILLNGFLLAYFIFVFRSKAKEKSVVSILSVLFLLHFFMDLFKYLF